MPLISLSVLPSSKFAAKGSFHMLSAYPVQGDVFSETRIRRNLVAVVSAVEYLIVASSSSGSSGWVESSMNWPGSPFQVRRSEEDSTE